MNQDDMVVVVEFSEAKYGAATDRESTIAILATTYGTIQCKTQLHFELGARTCIAYPPCHYSFSLNLTTVSLSMELAYLWW
jgi:hypothetical protein